MRVVVRIVNGSRAGEQRPLEPGGVLRVGRLKPSDWVLEHDPQLGNTHFELAWDGAECRLREVRTRFGTLVNGVKVTEATLRDGDRIEAGRTTFEVRMVAEAASAPAAADVPAAAVVRSTGAAPASLAPASVMTLPDVLRAEAEPLYLLLDAARSLRALQLLQSLKVEHQSLYEGPEGEQLALFAPYLAPVAVGSPLFEAFAAEGWGQSWGLFLSCALPFAEVRRHLRRFLTVEVEGGKRMYFRFYDPRVLRVYLPTCTPDELATFFGPVGSFLTEDTDPATLLRFRRAGRGLERRAVALALPRAQAS